LEGERLVAARGVDPVLAREGIAFYQVASHLFRNGLYGDEEQIAPRGAQGVERAAPPVRSLR